MFFWCIYIYLWLKLDLPFFINVAAFILSLSIIEREERLRAICGLFFAIIILCLPIARDDLIREIKGDELIGYAYYADESGFDFYADVNGKCKKFKVKTYSNSKNYINASVNYASIENFIKKYSNNGNLDFIDKENQIGNLISLKITERELLNKVGFEDDKSLASTESETNLPDNLKYDGKKLMIASFYQSEPLKANRDGFNYDSYLISKEYSGILYPREIEILSSDNSVDSFYRRVPYSIRQFFLKKGEVLNSDARKLYEALIFGKIGDNWISRTSKELGIIHLFVISGFHFTLIVGSIKKFLEIIFKRYYNLVQLLTLLVAILYFLMNQYGFGSLRALIMLAFGMFCFYTKRYYDSIRVLVIIGGVWAILNPEVIWQIGFQLSFLGSFAVVIAGRLKFVKNIKAKLLSEFVIGAVVFVIIMPVLIYHNGQVSVVQIFILPIITVIISAFAVMSLLLAILPSSLANFKLFELLLVKPLNWLSWLIKGSLYSFLELSRIKLDMQFALVIFLSSFALILILLKMRGAKGVHILKRVAIALLCSSLLIVNQVDLGLSVRTFALSDGEAYLIRYPNKTVVYDVGNDDKIVELLKKAGVSRIDMLIISHKHMDHIGKLKEVVQNFEIGELVLKVDSLKRVTLGSADIYLNSLMSNSKDDVLDGKEGAVINNSSILMRLDYFGENIVLNGDIEELGIDNYMRLNEFDIVTQFVKLPHHGSYRSNFPDLVKRANPQFALIAGGRGKSIKKKQSIEMLNSMGIPYYDTNIDGEIFINYWLNNWYIKKYN